jgi:hypothetical protein
LLVAVAVGPVLLHQAVVVVVVLEVLELVLLYLLPPEQSTPLPLALVALAKRAAVIEVTKVQVPYLAL